MTYEQLKQIAQPHIRENSDIPSNSLLLLIQLHIPFKTKKQCEDDYKGKICPLYNYPAFLAINNSGGKIIYFDSNSIYWNFYVFHEIAHYILDHKDTSPQNEIDADMLACILAAPIENLPTTVKTARDLSALCKIPIDKSEIYWDTIRNSLHKPRLFRNKIFVGCGLLAILFTLILFVGLITSFNTKDSHLSNNASNQSIEQEFIEQETQPHSDEKTYYMTSSGTHYHKQGCVYLNNKSNIIAISYDEAINLRLEPCKVCIGE